MVGDFPHSWCAMQICGGGMQMCGPMSFPSLFPRLNLPILYNRLVNKRVISELGGKVLFNTLLL